jgi:hypothetical protein
MISSKVYFYDFLKHFEFRSGKCFKEDFSSFILCCSSQSSSGRSVFGNFMHSQSFQPSRRSSLRNSIHNYLENFQKIFKLHFGFGGIGALKRLHDLRNLVLTVYAVFGNAFRKSCARANRNPTKSASQTVFRANFSDLTCDSDQIIVRVLVEPVELTDIEAMVCFQVPDELRLYGSQKARNSR